MKIEYNMQYLLTNDTAEQWSSSNPTIPKGLLVADTTNNKLKLGNGTNAWNDLPYLSDKEIEAAKNEINETIQQIQTDLAKKANSGTTLTEYGITDAYTKEETELKIAEKIAAQSHMETSVVEQLPDVGDANNYTIYLVAKDGDKPQDGYIEYLLINNKFEIIGNTDIDLTNYITTESLDTELAKKADNTTIEFTEGTFKVKDDVLGIQPEDYGTTAKGGTIKSSEDNNKIKIGEDGTAEVNKISFAKLFVDPEDTVVINGGTSASLAG